MSTPMTSLSETSRRQKRPISFSGMNADQVRAQLTSQLEEKEKLLSQAGASQISRNALSKQRDVIKKELARLNQYSQEEELPNEILSKLEDLANEFQYLKSSKSIMEDSSAKNLTPLLPPPPTNSTPTKHRNKNPNGNRRNPDIEFATEIGQGLLIEVRKLQTALQEKEEIIKQLELSKADNERTQETAQRHLKQRDEVEERLKEEVWNLEVANQELRTHLLESNQNVAKHNSDYAKLTKQLKAQSEQIDIMKAQEEKSASVIEAMKARHEQETHQLRRHAATAQRENAQTQKQVEALNTELKIVNAKLAIKMASSSRALDESAKTDITREVSEDDDSETNQNKSVSPSASTTTSNRGQQALETETLKQSLAHAHRIISNLRSSYHKEKLEKFEIKKMLSDSQENIELMRKEMANWNSDTRGIAGGQNGGRGGNRMHGKKKPVTKRKMGGVGRQPRGLCLNDSDSDKQLRTDEENDVLIDSDDDTVDEDNELDQHFTEYGNSFGVMSNFMPDNGLSSFAMKPLSSELEAKKQVIDVGVNTDPMDLGVGPCMHGSAQELALPVSPSNLLVGSSSFYKQGISHTHSAPFTLPPNQEHSQEPEYLRNTSRSVVDESGATVTPGTIPSSLEVVSKEQINNHISVALVNERKVIAERAASMLSPEQINILLEPSQTSDTLALSNTNAGKDVEVDGHMLTQKQVDILIHEAVTKETAAMVPKSEIEVKIQEAIIKEQEKFASLDLISRTEADKLVQQAVDSEKEKAMDLISKTEASVLVQKAVESEKEKAVGLISKSEADVLVQKAIESEKEKLADFIPKTEAEILVKEAVTAEQEKISLLNMIPMVEVEEMIEMRLQDTKKANEILLEETRTKLSTQFKAREEEIVRDMITKREAEAATLAAVALANKEAHEKVTSLNNIAHTVSDEELIRKEEADKLIKQAIQNEQSKIQQALDKQRADIEALASTTHKKELEASLTQQRLELESLKQKEIEQHIAALEAAKQTELSVQKNMLETSKNTEIEQQLRDLEAAKQSELRTWKDKLDAEKSAALEEAEQAKQTDLERITRDMTVKMEQQKLSVEEALKTEFEQKISEMEQQKIHVEETLKSEFEQKISEIQDDKKCEIEKLQQANVTEIEALKNTIESYKKDCEEINQRMITMLTKDSVDVLVKRAVVDAVERAEKKQAEVLAGMISREYSEKMVKDEVAKALEAERKEVSQREEAEAMEMISKAEAEALAKVAAADAIVKERQAMAARENELISREEAQGLTDAAVREAIGKERNESAEVLAKERKLLREKEENYISKEEAEMNTKEAVRLALLEAKTKAPELSTVSHLNISSGNPQPSSDHPRQLDNIDEAFTPPAGAIERSVSTSRLTPPTLRVSPVPSVSTPASSSSRKLRLSSSVSSLRLGSGRKENNIQKSQRPNYESNNSSGLSFGSFRILENKSYGSTRLQSKSSMSLRELSNKQDSATSISTMSSDEGLQSHTHAPMPMSSDDTFAGFSSSGGTDIYVISAITQTMIGEWMSKHTRRYVGSGISENKHQRFFWVHPYSKMLYWSSVRPGADGNTAKTKSAFIESVSAVPSGDNTGTLSPMSLLIRTPKRQLKLTAPSLERHELWLKSLSYLLVRPNSSSSQIVEEPRYTTESGTVENAGHQQTTLSSRGMEESISHAQDLAQYDSDDSEDLVNIRQCCDGKHDVSTLSRNNHHHH